MFYFFNAGKWSKASYLPGYCYLPQKISPYVASTKRIVYAFLSECQWKKNHKTKTKKNLLEFTALIFWWSVRQRHRNPQNLVCTYPLKYLEKYDLVFEENFDMISLTFLWQCCNSQEDVTSGSLLFLLSISYHPTLLASLLLLSFVDLCFFKTFCFHLFENESGILQETLLKVFFSNITHLLVFSFWFHKEIRLLLQWWYSSYKSLPNRTEPWTIFKQVMNRYKNKQVCAFILAMEVPVSPSACL